MGYAYDGIASGLAEQIKAQRKARGWTQQELARRSGVSLKSVQRLENPRGDYDPYIETVAKLAATFDVALVAQFIPVSQMIAELANSRLPERLVPASFNDEMGQS